MNHLLGPISGHSTWKEGDKSMRAGYKPSHRRAFPQAQAGWVTPASPLSQAQEGDCTFAFLGRIRHSTGQAMGEGCRQQNSVHPIKMLTS